MIFRVLGDRLPQANGSSERVDERRKLATHECGPFPPRTILGSLSMRRLISDFRFSKPTICIFPNRTSEGDRRERHNRGPAAYY